MKMNTYQEAAKERASEYRKAQYQKLKTQAKEKKREQKGRSSPTPVASYPEDIEAALQYFSGNGFPMPEGPSKEILNEAKRKLSRIFHPDKGGSHAESVELNTHYELLINFLWESQ